VDQLLNLVTPLHEATERDYLGRMLDEKVRCMQIAKEYEAQYWDGDRRFGYGGYKYIPGRWAPVAQGLIAQYGLNDFSSVLDIGCGKAFLLYELKKLLPGLRVAGLDVSKHGLENAPKEIRPHLVCHAAEHPLPFRDEEFDLVISLGAFHNLRLYDLEIALPEMERVGQNGYLMLESYRNEQELFNLQCWALTAESFLEPSEWLWLYRHFGYSGDYEFIFFE
jgi:SAM-dependent methyltransferase